MDKIARNGQPSTIHWTSGGIATTTGNTTPPLAKHQPIVEGVMWRTDELNLETNLSALFLFIVYIDNHAIYSMYLPAT